MIVVEKKLRGIVPYRIVYWPTEAVLKEMAEDLPLTHYVRAEAAGTDLDHGRCLVGHHLSLTLILDLRRSFDELYKDLIANARIRIHKAEKLGNRAVLRRYRGGRDSENLIEQFVAIYNQLVRGKPTVATPISAEYVRSCFPHADLIMTYLDGRLICGHLNLVDKDVGASRLLHSANQRFQDAATARLAGILNVYLHWYEIETYRKEGLISYDFGSIGQVEDSVGVNRFKMQFGGSIVREHNYIFAGMPRAWRAAFTAMAAFTSRRQRQIEVEKAGDRWRHMSADSIRKTIESSIEDYQRGLQERRQPSKHRGEIPASSDLSLLN
jgi:hypothetical protein